MPSPAAAQRSTPAKGTKPAREKPPPRGKVRPSWAPGPGIRERDPSPLHGKAAATRKNRMLAILEAAASEGDVGAAKYWLDWYRWDQEMKHGRPGSKGGEAPSGPTIIIGNSAAIVSADPETARLLRQLRQGKPAGALTDRTTITTGDERPPD